MLRIVSCFLVLFLAWPCSIKAGQKTVMFDLSHGQCRGIEPGFETYPEVIPGYEAIVGECGARLLVNDSSEINAGLLSDVDVLIMLSPLSNTLQRDITAVEKQAIVDFVKGGGCLLFFVDDEHRVDITRYGANDITRPFGIEFGPDVKGLPGNCGAVSFENEIFGGRREIPYSGARLMRGGIPASVCMEQGYLHASFVKLPNGGKLFVAADTMVGLLMGYEDGERNVSKKMLSRWWGKDSRLYMRELIQWMLSD